MKRSEILFWSALGLLGTGLLCWSFPTVFPLVPAGEILSAAEAGNRAQEILQELGQDIDLSSLRTRLDVDDQLDRALQDSWRHLDGPISKLIEGRSRSRLVSTGPTPGAGPPGDRVQSQWVRLGLDGSLTGLELRSQRDGGRRRPRRVERFDHGDVEGCSGGAGEL